jgi:hypoxanthine phosphoribosyltransferase
MEADVQEVLIDSGRIAQRVEQVAQQIIADLTAPDTPGFDHGDEITLVPILTGSIIFVADLMRHLPFYMRIRMMSVSSYPGAAMASKGARVEHQLTNLPEDLSGAHVLVIDDILDTGGTLKLVDDELRRRNPAMLRSCVLLKKLRPEPPEIEADYACFEIPDRFVIGYGLDFNDRYRNLPYIGVLREAVYRGEG